MSASRDRDEKSYRVESAIFIPAGTILRDQGGGKFGCDFGLQDRFGRVKNISFDMGEAPDGISGWLKKVIAA